MTLVSSTRRRLVAGLAAGPRSSRSPPPRPGPRRPRTTRVSPSRGTATAIPATPGSRSRPPTSTGCGSIAYRGRTDDGPGTVIQNRGIAAAPYGPHGGTGLGGLGNYQVTAHRTSHGGVFGRTPSLRKGDKAIVDSARWRYVYRITRTRWVSFRSQESLRRQRAAVPGHPGKKPHHGYITISTCATPEDHARGNYWTDRYGNPEHRIDKIGVLVRRVPNPYWHRR